MKPKHLIYKPTKVFNPTGLSQCGIDAPKKQSKFGFQLARFTAKPNEFAFWATNTPLYMKFFLRLAAIIVMFSLLGCQEDEGLPEAKDSSTVLEQANGIIIKKKLPKAEFEHNNLIQTQINSLSLNNNQQNFLMGTANGGQNTNDPLLNGLTVVDDYANYIELPNGAYSYTFALQRTPKTLGNENLLVQTNANGETNMYLIQYDLTLEERIQMANSEVIEGLESKIFTHQLNQEQQDFLMFTARDVPCTTVLLFSNIGCAVWYNPCSGYSVVGSECDNYLNHYDDVSDDGGGGGGGSGSGWGGPSGGNSGSNGTNGNNNGNSSSGDSGFNNGDNQFTDPIDLDIPDTEVPCQKIAEQLEDEDFDEKLEELKGLTSAQIEYGYVETTNGFGNRLQGNANGGRTINFGTIPNNILGYIHTHFNFAQVGVDTNGDPIIKYTARIFSPGDVITFINMLKVAENNGTPLDDVYAYVIADKTYTLRFGGSDTSGLPDTSNLNIESLNQQYNNLYNKHGVELGFLLFLKNVIGTSNIQLFRVKNNGTVQAKTLSLDNKKVKKENCE